jgi:hypothetical protein
MIKNPPQSNEAYLRLLIEFALLCQVFGSSSVAPSVFHYDEGAEKLHHIPFFGPLSCYVALLLKAILCGVFVDLFACDLFILKKRAIIGTSRSDLCSQFSQVFLE